MIAVCLLTADRPELTRRTLETFVAHNPDRSKHLLYHADDGTAPNSRIFDDVRHAGFQTVYKSDARRGQIPALEQLWGCAISMGATRILHLENDQEWVAPIPEDVIAPCVRLYGRLKARSGPRAPTGTKIMGTDMPIVWTPFGTRWERAIAHWGGQPSITVAGPLWDALQSARRIKDISNTLRLETLRPLENITWHIGEDETTPGRIPGAY